MTKKKLSSLRNMLKSPARRRIEQLEKEVDILRSELDNVRLFSSEVTEILQGIDRLHNEVDGVRKSILKREELLDRQKIRGAVYDRSDRPAVLPSSKSMDRSLDELKKLCPSAFPVWSKLLSVNENTYKDLPMHSCSVSGHPTAEIFKSFVRPYLAGRVLDIGCGPQQVPLYLQGYPTDLIFGIDPISLPQDHPFEFVKGVAEFLPWGNDVFDTLIAATSLDHTLLPDKVCNETHRVLSKRGYFLVWESFVKSPKTYNPFGQNPQPVDEYHLFHFNKEWFEEMMGKYFIIEEVFRVKIEIDHYFYSFKPRRI